MTQFIEVKPAGYWQERAGELTAAATDKDCVELARMYQMPAPRMRAILRRLEIKAKPVPKLGIWQQREKELRKIAPRMTSKDLASYYGCTVSSVRQALRTMRIKSKSGHPDIWTERECELRTLAKTMTAIQLAEHYGLAVSSMHNRLLMMGIKAVSLHTAKKRAAEPKPAKPKPRRPALITKPIPAAAIQRQQNPTAAKARLDPDAPVVVPDNLQITYLPLAFPADTRICNGTSTKPYIPNSRPTGHRY